MMRFYTKSRRILAIAFLTAGCASDHTVNSRSGTTGGTIVISASADADILLPSLTLSVQGKQIGDQIFDNLADIGDDLNTVGDAGFKPRLASSWQWAPDSSWIEFKIHPNARWHDGQPVTASDVAFTFALIKDTAFASHLSSNLANVDSVSVVEPSRARVWLASSAPNTFFRIASGIAILPRHILEKISAADLRSSKFSREPVGSGRFKFSKWTTGTSVILTADSTNYRGRPQADKAVWLIAQDYDGAALRFMSGQADFLDMVKPEFIERIRSSGRAVSSATPSLGYGYVAFNLRDGQTGKAHPVLSNRDVRRALVMSVDRAALVRNVLDTLGRVAHGPVTRALATSDTTVGLAYDPTSAAKGLDAAGWKRGPDGMRTKNGKPLSFTLMVPSSSTQRMRFAVLLQDQWKKAGADVRIESLELSTFGSRMEDRKFDALLNAWQIDPDPSSVRDEWMSAERNVGGFNFASYASPVVDALLDSAYASRDPERSRSYYRKAYHEITADAPALWLYESPAIFGIAPRIETTGMRADAWWAGLADWKVKSL